MYNLTMFTTEEELMQLTGITDHDKLWDVGFNLDDWDVGFCCDKPLDHECPAEDDSSYRVANDDTHWLVWQMENYCVGYEYVEYNGKHYYTVHHS